MVEAGALIVRKLQRAMCIVIGIAVASSEICRTGGLAQLVERSLCMREVIGSIPVSSIMF